MRNKRAVQKNVRQQQYLHHLQLQLCPPPMPPLGIIPEEEDVISSGMCNFLLYLMVFPVLILIHWGMGLFCQLSLDAEGLESGHDEAKHDSENTGDLQIM